MAVFVVDASVALAWCFEDEATRWSEEFLERLRQGDRIIVPAHWGAEVANALLSPVLKKVVFPSSDASTYSSGTPSACAAFRKSPSRVASGNP